MNNGRINRMHQCVIDVARRGPRMRSKFQTVVPLALVFVLALLPFQFVDGTLAFGLDGGGLRIAVGTSEEGGEAHVAIHGVGIGAYAAFPIENYSSTNEMEVLRGRVIYAAASTALTMPAMVGHAAWMRVPWCAVSSKGSSPSISRISKASTGCFVHFS